MKYRLNTMRLKEKREEKGWNKLEAAQHIGLPQSVYLRYENGERNPTYSVIKNIANSLETSPEYLTDQTDNPVQLEYIIRIDDKKLSFIIEKYNTLSEENKSQLYEYVKLFPHISTT